MPIPRPVHTYSVVARDPDTGQIGVAVQSHYFGVGPIVPWAEAGVGAVATQAMARVDYGPLGIAAMREGRAASEVMVSLLAQDDGRDMRQVAMIDAHGDVSAHTGERCIAAAGHYVGRNFSVQANMMMDDTIVPAMAAAFPVAMGDLADKLLATLVAAQEAGGDFRGQQSAAIVVVSGEKQTDRWQGRLFDLRVEDHPRPLEELARLIQLRRAYQWMDQGDEELWRGEIAAATESYSKAVAFAPEVMEVKFWAGVNQVAGGLDEGHALLKEVFAAEPIWRDAVQRLVAVELLPNDPALIESILAN